MPHGLVRPPALTGQNLPDCSSPPVPSPGLPPGTFVPDDNRGAPESQLCRCAAALGNFTFQRFRSRLRQTLTESRPCVFLGKKPSVSHTRYLIPEANPILIKAEKSVLKHVSTVQR